MAYQTKTGKGPMGDHRMTGPQHHMPEAWLVDYAAGTLDEANALLVACHAALCPSCRETLRLLDGVGGALLDEARPVPVADDALSRLFARIDAEDAETAEDAPDAGMAAARDGATTGRHGVDLGSLLPLGADTLHLPRPLLAYLPTRPDALPWRWSGPGVHTVDLAVGRPGTRTVLMKIGAGRAMPHHTHKGTEALMVLAGGYRDHSGDFLPGDVAISTGAVDHRPIAHDDGDCLCLAVLDAPITLTGTLGRLLNPFIRF